MTEEEVSNEKEEGRRSDWASDDDEEGYIQRVDE